MQPQIFNKLALHTGLAGDHSKKQKNPQNQDFALRHHILELSWGLGAIFVENLTDKSQKGQKNRVF